MSIPALIDSYGRTMTRTRPVMTRDTVGSAYLTAAGSTAAVTGYLQAGAGGVSLRYGREAVRYAATAYFLCGTDIREHDTLTVTIGTAAGTATRTYRVDSVRTPDDRPASDHMCHMIVTLEEDLPRT